jgi:hypothetical protein
MIMPIYYRCTECQLILFPEEALIGCNLWEMDICPYDYEQLIGLYTEKELKEYLEESQ